MQKAPNTSLVGLSGLITALVLLGVLVIFALITR